MYTEQMTQGVVINAAPIPPQNLAPATPTGTGGIDMQLFRRAFFILSVGAYGASATVDMKLQESTDNVTFTDLVGTGVAIIQMTAGAGNNKESTLEVRAGQITKRYVRALVTVGTTASQVCCIALGGEANHKPGNLQSHASVTQQVVVS
jgi:hypothetical protein